MSTKEFMDHYERSSLNCFAAQSIDRAHMRRRDGRWISERLNASTSRILPLWRSKHLLNGGATPRPVMFSPHELADLIETAESMILLGEEDGTAFFALDVPPEDSMEKRFAPFGQFRDLKASGALLSPRDGTLLAYARAMTHWHRRNRFCGDCGSPTACAEGGHVRTCTNEECGQQHFPRTDPAIIVLVAAGDSCLLGRQPVWPKGMYSTIAGFVEPGESVEDAVIREVGEETGISPAAIHYHSSQPWPFPASLMLGFTAQAPKQDIRIDLHELEDARWFSREEIEGSLRSGALRLPTNISIAFRLIEDWFDGAEDGRLKRLLSSISDPRT